MRARSEWQSAYTVAIEALRDLTDKATAARMAGTATQSQIAAAELAEAFEWDSETPEGRH